MLEQGGRGREALGPSAPRRHTTPPGRHAMLTLPDECGSHRHMPPSRQADGADRRSAPVPPHCHRQRCGPGPAFALARWAHSLQNAIALPGQPAERGELWCLCESACQTPRLGVQRHSDSHQWRRWSARRLGCRAMAGACGGGLAPAAAAACWCLPRGGSAAFAAAPSAVAAQWGAGLSLCALSSTAMPPTNPQVPGACGAGPAAPGADCSRGATPASHAAAVAD